MNCWIRIRHKMVIGQGNDNVLIDGGELVQEGSRYDAQRGVLVHACKPIAGGMNSDGRKMEQVPGR